MKVDELWMYSLLLVFVRSSAMFLASPLFGGSVPARVRVLFCFMFSVCVLPAAKDTIREVPPEMYSLFVAIVSEAAIGLIIGLCIQLLLLAAQMAGAFMDMQLGFQMMQMFNPQMGGQTTVLGQFKFLLFLVLVLLLDGHHMMLNAFVQSYQSPLAFDAQNLNDVKNGLVHFIGGVCILALQISAPVAAVSFIVDASSGVINKSIPQMPVSMVTMGAKTAMGITAIALGLPLMVVAVKNGLAFSGQQISEILTAASR